MKEIHLTQSKVALVDDEDYERLKKHKWYAHLHRRIYYARRKEIGGAAIEMHHEIIGKPTDGLITDHIDGNGLNNQRNNLHHVTVRENGQKRMHPKSSSFPGVTWHKRHRKWMSQIEIEGKNKYLGLFNTEINAFRIYLKAVKEIRP